MRIQVSTGVMEMRSSVVARVLSMLAIVRLRGKVHSDQAEAAPEFHRITRFINCYSLPFSIDARYDWNADQRLKRPFLK